MATIRFQFNPEKFVNAVAYLAQACPNSTKLTICKQLYYADKEHLVRYGRPITGDQYYKLPHGPCPTRGLDLLRGRSDEAASALLQKHVKVAGVSVKQRAETPINRKVFSKTDLEVLEWVIREYGHLSAAELSGRTHSESPWKDSLDGFAIDYALFFDEDRPEAAEMKKLAEAEQEARDALRPYATNR